MFLESAEREWYNWGGTGLCMPQLALDWLPRVFLRCAAGRSSSSSCGTLTSATPLTIQDLCAAA